MFEKKELCKEELEKVSGGNRIHEWDSNKQTQAIVGKRKQTNDANPDGVIYLDTDE